MQPPYIEINLIVQIIRTGTGQSQYFYRRILSHMIRCLTTCICRWTCLMVGANNTIKFKKCSFYYGNIWTRTWQWHPVASMYSYRFVSGSTFGWQCRSRATDLERPACMQTGWKDRLYGNRQSDISFESHWPQHDHTLTWSQHSRPSICSGVDFFFSNY